MNNLESIVKRSSTALQKIAQNNLRNIIIDTPKKQKLTDLTSFIHTNSTNNLRKPRRLTPEIILTDKVLQIQDKQKYTYSNQVKNNQATGQNIRHRQQQTIKKIPQYFGYTDRNRVGSQYNNEKQIINFRSSQHDNSINNHGEKQFFQSNLQMDLSRFKRSIDGNLIRISNRKPVQQALFKVKQIKPRNGQVVILNAHKLSQLIGKQLRSLDQFLQNPETQQIIINYFIQNGHLEQGCSSKIAFEFFHQLCAEKLKRKFTCPLIKKYKNCIYYGEKPPDQIYGIQGCSYQGFLYYYNSRIYIGEFIQGKKNGKGFQISFSKKTFSRGTFKNGSKQGFFKIEKKGQYKYEGDVINGVFEGKGILTTKFSKYEGNFKDGYKSGYGQQVFYLTEQCYFGQYSDGLFQGRGQIRGPNYFFKGYFKNNLKQKEGYEKTQFQQYRGNFSAGKRDGYGILTFKNGDTYKGDFRDGQMYGKGQIKYQNGVSLVGYFVNNRMVSQNKETVTMKHREQKYNNNRKNEKEQKSILGQLKNSQQFQKATAQRSADNSEENELQQSIVNKIPNFNDIKNHNNKPKRLISQNQTAHIIIKNQQQQLIAKALKKQKIEKKQKERERFNSAQRSKSKEISRQRQRRQKIPILEVGQQDSILIRRRN